MVMDVQVRVLVGRHLPWSSLQPHDGLVACRTQGDGAAADADEPKRARTARSGRQGVRACSRPPGRDRVPAWRRRALRGARARRDSRPREDRAARAADQRPVTRLGQPVASRCVRRTRATSQGIGQPSVGKAKRPRKPAGGWGRFGVLGKVWPYRTNNNGVSSSSLVGDRRNGLAAGAVYPRVDPTPLSALRPTRAKMRFGLDRAV